jgi:hypothetical protein
MEGAETSSLERIPAFLETNNEVHFQGKRRRECIPRMLAPNRLQHSCASPLEKYGLAAPCRDDNAGFDHAAPILR